MTAKTKNNNKKTKKVIRRPRKTPEHPVTEEQFNALLRLVCMKKD